jgi:hypothetical protein
MLREWGDAHVAPAFVGRTTLVMCVTGAVPGKLVCRRAASGPAGESRTNACPRRTRRRGRVFVRGNARGDRGAGDCEERDEAGRAEEHGEEV